MNKIDTIYINTESATDLSGMFKECTGLTSLNLDNFKTSNVTDMFEMFYSCNNLKYLTLKNFDTSKLINMNNMFQGCQELTSLDLSSFNTPNLVNIEDLFYGCSSLYELDLSNFNTSLVQDSSNIFFQLPNEGKITFNSEKLTINIINLIPKGWEKNDIKDDGEKEENGGKDGEGKQISNNYLIVKFDIPKDSMEIKLFNQFSTPPTYYDYIKNILFIIGAIITTIKLLLIILLKNISS